MFVKKRNRALGLVVPVAIIIGLAGCAAEPAPVVPAEGGDLVAASPYATDSLDPHGPAGMASGTVLVAQEIFSRLVKANTSGEIVSDLAASWETNDTATEWTFTLREDVTFSDGSPLTSADVVASFNRVLELKGPVAGNFAGVTISNPDDFTVVFTSDKSEAALLGKLTVFFVTPADVTDASFTEPVGSGPFVLDSFTPGSEVVLAPNEEYFDGAPLLDSLTFRVIPEVAARLTALQSGEVQVTWGVPDDQLPQLQSDPGLVVETVPSTSVATMWFNSSRPALSSAEVRNAIWQAVDFDTIIAALFPETGEAATSAVAENVFGFAAQTPKEYDPDAAKAALEDAGFDFSQTLQIQFSGATYRQFIQAIASDLAKIGVTAEPTEKESAVFLEDLLALNWDINFQALSTATFDAATNLGRLYPCAANRTGYCNDELDALLLEAGGTSDLEVRQEAYADAIEIIWDDAVGMYPMALKIAYASQSTVQGLDPDPSFLPEFSKVSVSQ
jgi:peptide/nickel transport system substrate-binding protein